jgi:hypothetical protein
MDRVASVDRRHADARFLSDGCARAREEKPVMSRLAIALMLALAATTADAQPRSEPSQPPAVAGENGLRPFLFVGRMPGDGARQRAAAGEKHRNAGAIVMPRTASQPERER